MALGNVIGEGLGFGLGMLIPGAQPFAPELAALGSGVGGMIQGDASKKKADKMDLPLVDPTQTAYLEELKRRRKSLETGTAYQPEQDLIREAGGKAQENVLKLSGGNVGAAVGNVMAVNRGTGKNLNELYGQMSLEGLKVDAMIGSLTDTIASRRLGIQVYKQQQSLAEATQQQQDAMRNISALTAQGGGWIKKLLAKIGGSDASSVGSSMDNSSLGSSMDNPSLLGPGVAGGIGSSGMGIGGLG